MPHGVSNHVSFPYHSLLRYAPLTLRRGRAHDRWMLLLSSSSPHCSSASSRFGLGHSTGTERILESKTVHSSIRPTHATLGRRVLVPYALPHLPPLARWRASISSPAFPPLGALHFPSSIANCDPARNDRGRQVPYGRPPEERAGRVSPYATPRQSVIASRVGVDSRRGARRMLSSLLFPAALQVLKRATSHSLTLPALPPPHHCSSITRANKQLASRLRLGVHRQVWPPLQDPGSRDC